VAVAPSFVRSLVRSDFKGQEIRV